MKRFFPILLLLVLPAYSASPQITGVSPLGVVPGKKTILTLSGSNLDNVTNLWTSFESSARLITNSARAATFELLCEGEPGVGAVQAYGPDGVSDFRLVLVDPFPLRPPATNRVAPGTAVDAAFASEKANSYGFLGRAGEPVSIEVLAHRLGSQADPVLRVLDANGREAAFSDDEEGIWLDSRLTFNPPTDGEYTLLLHDVGYAGGSQYFYRLRLGAFPILSFSFPLRDWTEHGTREGSIDRPALSPANPPAEPWFSELPMLIEREPNDEDDAAQEFGLPIVINGRFQCDDDRDLFRFTAAKGERLSFLAQSRSLGSPCDVLLRIRTLSGEVLAENDVQAANELPFAHTFARAGTYLVEARELTGEFPANAPYRIKITKWTPAFELSAEANKLELAPGETGKVKITCERAGYDGEITLKSADVQLENNVIPPKAKEVELSVKPLDPGKTLVQFRITGHGTNGVTRPVSTRPALKKTFPLMLNPPPQLDGLISVGTKAK